MWMRVPHRWYSHGTMVMLLVMMRVVVMMMVSVLLCAVWRWMLQTKIDWPSMVMLLHKQLLLTMLLLW